MSTTNVNEVLNELNEELSSTKLKFPELNKVELRDLIITKLLIQTKELKRSTTLTIKQIMAIADFAGLVIAEDKSFSNEDKESFLETEFTIENDVEVSLDGKNYYKGKTVHCSEYPEEGHLPLEQLT